MSKVDWSLAPTDAQYGGIYEGRFSCWYLRDGEQWYYTSNISGAWEKVVDNKPSSTLIARPKKPTARPGPEDWLPPVGTVCETTFDDGRYSWGYWLKTKILCYGEDRTFMSQLSRGTDNNWLEGAIDSSGLKYRAIKTDEQIAQEKRESAIREVMDIAQVDCRVTAARLVDAGFKREVK